METQDEEIKGCKKILQIISLMSFANLNDEQVYKLTMMREIARQVIERQFEGVSRIDVSRALRLKIDNMVHACKETLDIISRMSYEGLGDQRIQSLMKMKEIAGGIVEGKADVSTPQLCEFCEQVDGFTSERIAKSIMDYARGGCHEDYHSQNSRQKIIVNEVCEVEAFTKEDYLVSWDLVDDDHHPGTSASTKLSEVSLSGI